MTGLQMSSDMLAKRDAALYHTLDNPDRRHDADGFVEAQAEPTRLTDEARHETGSQRHDSGLKDSGERKEVGTGAVRERSSGKGRFDLLPMFGLLLAALQMEKGVAKYSDRNWEKGQPLSWFADAALRHLVKHISGFDDEPHLDAALWNLMCLAEGRERIKRGLWPAHLDDLPKTYAGQQPGF
jgi:hypothetical protein